MGIGLVWAVESRRDDHLARTNQAMRVRRANTRITPVDQIVVQYEQRYGGGEGRGRCVNRETNG